jgi:hypothetical protein
MFIVCLQVMHAVQVNMMVLDTLYDQAYHENDLFSLMFNVIRSTNQYSFNNTTVILQFRQTETYDIQQPTEHLNKYKHRPTPIVAFPDSLCAEKKKHRE